MCRSLCYGLKADTRSFLYTNGHCFTNCENTLNNSRSIKPRTKPQAAPKKVVGYIRVSTEDQAAHGVSIAAQRERLEAYCVATGRRIDVMIVDEGQSAKNLDRAGMRRILDGVAADEIGTVIVLKIDRATRSVKDLALLLDLFAKHNADFVSVSEAIDTSSAAGRMIVNLLGVLAQFEREQGGERTEFALAHKRRNRQAYAHAAFGWQRDGETIIPVQDEQKALRRMRKMHTEGHSLRDIGSWLTANGYIPRQGGKEWYAASVKAVLISRIATEAAYHR